MLQFLLPGESVEQFRVVSFLSFPTVIAFVAISSNISTRGIYGVGVGPLVQKHPVGKFTVGKHSKPNWE